VQPERPGRWVAFPDWPHASVQPELWNLGSEGLTRDTATASRRIIDSPLETGLTFGEWCPYSGTGELPEDQRADDGRSVVFQTAPLERPLAIVGAPLIDLDITLDDETALLAARLQDVHPDGDSLNLTYGLLNISQRHGAAAPQAFPAGARETVRLKLNDVAHVFPAGHRIRIALSTAFWPLIWPSPRHAAVTLQTEGSRLTLPVLREDAVLPKPPAFGSAIADDPGAITVHASGGRTRETVQDPATGTVVVNVHRARSDYHVNATGTEVSHQSGEVFSITRGQPNSARIEGWGDWSLSRLGWHVRTKSKLVLASTAHTFELSASMEAYESEALITARHFSFSIPRRLV
jgi:predicted acyl esterase